MANVAVFQDRVYYVTGEFQVDKNDKFENKLLTGDVSKTWVLKLEQNLSSKYLRFCIFFFVITCG